ncbi:MAG: hypothetical protein OXU61_02120 [Gammaproteobacteria bacterium]|nr:hypothetical protein [Gammaproteobacteria bacterium]
MAGNSAQPVSATARPVCLAPAASPPIASPPAASPPAASPPAAAPADGSHCLSGAGIISRQDCVGFVVPVLIVISSSASGAPPRRGRAPRMDSGPASDAAPPLSQPPLPGAWPGA